MAAERSQVIAFDIYGTLLDTSAISSAIQEHAQVSAQQATEMAALWRRYQLEYTWRLNSMAESASEQYVPFDVVTRRSLVHAALELGCPLSDAAVTAICAEYRKLPAFADAHDTLKALHDQPNIKVVIFSNGTSDMVTTALSSQVPPLLPYARTHVLIDTHPHFVGTPRKYKPAHSVYEALLRELGKEDSPGDVWLVSGNPFDVTGALSAGLRTLWVDRSGKGWVDHLLGSDVAPTRTIRAVEDVVEIVKHGELI